jgi:hypothetical protein
MSLTLEEDLEDPSGLFVDQARDSLDTSSSSETSDGGLGDALAVRKERKRRAKKGQLKHKKSRGREEEQKREEGRGKRDEHVVSQDLPVSLGSSLSESLSTWRGRERRVAVSKTEVGRARERERERERDRTRKEGRRESERTFSSSGHD